MVVTPASRSKRTGIGDLGKGLRSIELAEQGLIDALNAQSHPVGVVRLQHLGDGWVHRFRSGLEVDKGLWAEGEVLTQQGHQRIQALGANVGRGAATNVQRIHPTAAQHRREQLQLGAQRPKIAIKALKPEEITVSQ